MVAPKPVSSDEIKSKVNSLRFKLDNLRDDASLKSSIDSYTSLESKISNFTIRVSTLRQRKYAYNNLLEKSAVDLGNRIAAQASSIQAQISIQSTRLQNSLQAINLRLNALGNYPALPMVTAIENELDGFESQCDAAKNAVNSLFSGISSDASQYDRDLREIEYALDQVDLASFQMLSGESVVRAVKAVWCKNGKEEKNDPEGVLYLTDQRLIFEQKEEIATKKVLFVTTEKQKVQQFLFEVPVALIQEASGEKQGVFKNVDMLKLTLASGAFSPNAVLHLFDQDCQEWQKTIVLVKTHEIDSLRVIPVDTTAQEKVKAAPTQCPNCGGLINQPILRGQDTIKCEFCGATIRL
jgi:hypothetical protein